MTDLSAFLVKPADGADCPDDLRRSLDRYVLEGCPVGGFLQAVLENDLRGAIQRADPDNLARLRDIAAYVWFNVPASAYGSAQAYERHLKKRRAERMEAAVKS